MMIVQWHGLEKCSLHAMVEAQYLSPLKISRQRQFRFFQLTRILFLVYFSVRKNMFFVFDFD